MSKWDRPPAGFVPLPGSQVRRVPSNRGGAPFTTDDARVKHPYPTCEA